MADVPVVQVKPVQFYDHNVRSARTQDGRIYAIVRDLCQRLGIDFSTQSKLIQDDELYQGFILFADLPYTKKYQPNKALALDVEMVPIWLARIEANRVKPDRKALLLRYQRECARVLRDYWKGSSVIEAFLLPKPRDWELRFPWSFAKAVMRLYGLSIMPGDRFPEAVCTFISRYIYGPRIPAEVKPSLRAAEQRNPQGHRRFKTHQCLTPAADEQVTQDQLKRVWALVGESRTIKEFEQKYHQRMIDMATQELTILNVWHPSIDQLTMSFDEDAPVEE